MNDVFDKDDEFERMSLHLDHIEGLRSVLELQVQDLLPRIAALTLERDQGHEAIARLIEQTGRLMKERDVALADNRLLLAMLHEANDSA